MPKNSNHQPAGRAFNTGAFHTGMSVDSGMTGSTGAPGNTDMLDHISMADTVGSSENTNGREYSRKAMEQVGLKAGFGEGPTGGISGSDGSGVYGVTDRAGEYTDPSNSDVEGGWSLSDVKNGMGKGKKENSFRDLD